MSGGHGLGPRPLAVLYCFGWLGNAGWIDRSIAARKTRVTNVYKFTDSFDELF
jgi:hypothetical protein